MTTQRIIPGDCIAGLRTLPDASVHCCVTSPPYWGLRDYGHDGQIGLESTPEAYVARMVEVFREVRRVLRDDGTLWLNLGDSYCSQGGERKYGSSDGATGRGDAPGARLKDVGGFGDGTWDWIESNPTEDWATDEWLQELKRRRAKTSSASRGVSPSPCRLTAGGCGRTSSGTSPTRCPRACGTDARRLTNTFSCSPRASGISTTRRR
jgi:hypothetical protein